MSRSAPKVCLSSLTFIGALLALVVSIPFLHREAVGQERCVQFSHASADSVFSQALSTVRVITMGALKAKRSGGWRPDGSFADPFFEQAGSSLRDIRTLLNGATASQNQVSQATLLEAFDKIFDVTFPRGLRHLARLKRSERRKFVAEIETVSSTNASCN
jgi:hypothetical protein